MCGLNSEHIEPPLAEKPCILLVDDRITFHDKMRLNFAQYQFISAYTEKEALEKYTDESKHLDLVLLDIFLRENLQIPQGFNLIQPIKTRSPTLPVIMVTINREKREEALKRGADDYLQKDQFNIPAWQKIFDAYIHIKQQKDIIQYTKQQLIES